MTPLPSIHSQLFIGDDDDAHRTIRTMRQGKEATSWVTEPIKGWAIVHAAKSPWHTKLLGYSGAAPEGHPERWWADRDRETYLNLVDSPQQYDAIVMPIVQHGSRRIGDYLSDGLNVLVHCNQGMSRSPAVVLWWMGQQPVSTTFEESLAKLQVDHPYVRTDTGIMSMIKEHWDG